MKSKTFCAVPWTQIATSPMGFYRICCNSTPGKSQIRNSDGQIAYINIDNIEELWNNDHYKQIRQDMLDGKRLEMCERCYREEDAGAKSARQLYNFVWENKIKNLNAEADFDIKYVDIRLGNLCNLKCRMCSPFASNQWTDEWNEVVDEPHQIKDMQKFKNMVWPEDENTWKNLFAIANTVEEIYLTGGEPTIIKEQHKLLDYFIDNGTAQKIKLKYNTNLTNIPNHLLEKWKKFKLIKLNCSIDAVGDLNRYIRYPSNWNKILENFEKIRTLDNCRLEIHCTVQKYNIFHLSDFTEWAESYGYKIHYNILYDPVHLNIQSLPQDLKILAEQKLKDHSHKERIQQVINYMHQKDLSQYHQKFIDFTTKVDDIRNENLFDLVPEFKQ